MSAFKVWECQICNWVYDEEKGCPEDGLAPGTRWEDIPDDWCCPECGVGKDEFEMVEVKSSGEEPVALPEAEPVAATAAFVAPIVIIGTGLAGYQLAKEIRKRDKATPVVMYTADDGAFYSKPQLSNGFSAGKSATELVKNTAEEMAQQFDLEINIYSPIASIDTPNKRVNLVNGGSREYAKLVLATGSNCIDPSLSGDGLSSVHQVNDLLDYARFRTLMKPNSRILVIGAGLIGSEYADDLTRSGHKVIAVDPLDSALANLLPPPASRALTTRLRSAGVEFHFGTTVASVDHSPGGVAATLKNGTSIQADLVLSAIGVRPNIHLAQAAELTCGKGIQVNSTLRASAPDVYAAGDCAEVNGTVLPYVAPLTAQVKALANTLTGQETEVNYDVMPVLVKTKLHPINVNPVMGVDGDWQIISDDEAGVHAEFKDASGTLLGYALTGDYCIANAQLAKQCN